MEIELSSTECAICRTKNNSTVIYAANFSLESLTPDIFSARRVPDMIHYQIVRCNTCGLVRSDPVATSNLLKHLYEQSTFTYGQDIPNLKRTYGNYLRRLAKYNHSKNQLLELGCGNGFFLEEAIDQGYAEVVGMEPSLDAIRNSRPDIQQKIVNGILQPGMFLPDTFDVICMFQTFDHISDPGSLLNEILRILKPGGLVLCLNHNVDALSARVLGERSPIIDIEHTYLYNPGTFTKLFIDHSFRVLEAHPAWNVIRLHSLVRLFPMPVRLKKSLLAWIDSSFLRSVDLSLPIGNLYLVAQKANAHGE